MVKVGKFSFDKDEAKKLTAKEFADKFAHAEKALPRGLTLQEVHKKYCGKALKKQEAPTDDDALTPR